MTLLDGLIEDFIDRIDRDTDTVFGTMPISKQSAAKLYLTNAIIETLLDHGPDYIERAMFCEDTYGFVVTMKGKDYTFKCE